MGNRKPAVDKATWEQLCEKYTTAEIKENIGLCHSSITKYSGLYGVKPWTVCKKCNARFKRRGNELRCPACIEKSPPKENKKKDEIRPSRIVEIERKARAQGLRYADIQKAETLAMVGKIEV